MGRPNRGTGSAGPKKPNPPINRPQYGNCLLYTSRCV